MRIEGISVDLNDWRTHLWLFKCLFVVNGLR